jgi:hypothetical protein
MLRLLYKWSKGKEISKTNFKIDLFNKNIVNNRYEKYLTYIIQLDFLLIKNQKTMGRTCWNDLKNIKTKEKT